MLVVRNTFKLKFGKAREAVALTKEGLAILKRAGLDTPVRLLTDLTGRHYTLVLEMTVKNLTEYGAFIDLGGIDGLLHVTDMSYGRITHPSELLQVGQDVTVKILKFDRGKERVSLGIKQLEPDPWDTVLERYPVNSRVIGRVVNVTDYGAFVELEAGVEGLIHISEMTWSRREAPSAWSRPAIRWKP